MGPPLLRGEAGQLGKAGLEPRPPANLGTRSSTTETGEGGPTSSEDLKDKLSLKLFFFLNLLLFDTLF